MKFTRFEKIFFKTFPKCRPEYDVVWKPEPPKFDNNTTMWQWPRTGYFLKYWLSIKKPPRFQYSGMFWDDIFNLQKRFVSFLVRPLGEHIHRFILSQMLASQRKRKEKKYGPPIGADPKQQQELIDHLYEAGCVVGSYQIILTPIDY